MIQPRTSALLLPVVACLCLWPARASAQDVAWRHDYAAARKEATETGRPLLLDCGYDGCVWCRKLDATTFRDPAFAKALSERFVPVKIDAQRDEWVVRALGVESYPTLVLASPEGKVLGKHVGYADAAQVTVLLAKGAGRPAAPAAAPPAAPTAAALLLSQARAAHAAGRYADCLSLCSELTSNHGSSPQAAEARALVERMGADPGVRRQLSEQIAAGLDSLRPALAAGLER
jgi:thioredoxin-related protein